jgi:hypothetical protein
MRKSLLRQIILPTSFLFAGCSDVETDPASATVPESESTDNPQFRSTTWEDFPIVIDGVMYTDIDASPYQFEIEMGVYIGLEDFADVVTRWTSFQPCEDPDPMAMNRAEEDAKNSFFWNESDKGAAYVNAAAGHGLHVILPLPFQGTTLNDEPYCGDVIDDDPDELWSPGEDVASVRIPLTIPDYGAGKDLITTDFTNYWAGKAALYVNYVDNWDTNDVVWRWRVIEELRYWEPLEYEFARTVRDVVNTYDGTRRMTEYTAGHYLPERSTLYTLLEQRPAMPSNAVTFGLNPTAPVARLADGVGGTDPLYPIATPSAKDIRVERDAGDYLKPMFDDVLSGGYTGHILGSHAAHNRIHPYHRIRLGREALDNLATIYATNSTNESISQDPPDHILFHAPDLTMNGPYNMTADHARHDFWSGIHEAKGVWIYSMAYRDEHANHEAVWEEYVRALYLIKSEMRPYLVDGVKTMPALTHDGTQTVPYDYYMQIGPFVGSHLLALPDAPEYSTINHSLFTVDDVGYLIVTNSWNEEAEFTVEFGDCVDSVDIVSGSSAVLTVGADDITDTFEGIDARVYKITFC